MRRWWDGEDKQQDTGHVNFMRVLQIPISRQMIFLPGVHLGSVSWKRWAKHFIKASRHRKPGWELRGSVFPCSNQAMVEQHSRLTCPGQSQLWGAPCGHTGGRGKGEQTDKLPWVGHSWATEGRNKVDCSEECPDHPVMKGGVLAFSTKQKTQSLPLQIFRKGIHSNSSGTCEHGLPALRQAMGEGGISQVVP